MKEKSLSLVKTKLVSTKKNNKSSLIYLENNIKKVYNLNFDFDKLLNN